MSPTNDLSATLPKPRSIEDAERCVSTILDYYGLKSTASVRGSSLLDVCVALHEAGLQATGYRASLGALRSLDVPSVLQLVDRNGTPTFVACLGFDGGKFAIMDPQRGTRRYSQPDFARRWVSRALLRVDGPQPSETDRFKCFDLHVVPFGYNRMLIRASRTAVSRILPGEEAQELVATHELRSVEAHEAWITARAGSTPKGGCLAHRLHGWIEDGLMVSEAALREDVAGGGGGGKESEGRDEISSIGIPTNGRVDALDRSLRSYLTNLRLHGRQARMVVASTGGSEETVELGRRLDAIRSEYGASIVHLDDTWKRTMVDYLSAATGCRREIARFALLGRACSPTDFGANRNALLLATAGELTLQVDDDTMLPLVSTPTSRGISLSSAFDPNEYWFDDCNFDDVEGSEPDFLGLYESMLGRHPARVVSEYRTDEVDVADMKAPLLRTLGRPDATVGVVCLGHQGDSGTGANGWRLFLTGPSLQRLVQPGYTDRISHRDGARVVPKRTIGDGVFCSGMNLGFDNREGLPPFMPVGRNEEGVFSTVLSVCFPRCLRGFREGHVVRHVPVERRNAFAYPVCFEGFKANDLVCLIINDIAACRPAGVSHTLEAIGTSLSEIGSLEPPEFENVCRTSVCRAVAASVAQVEGTLVDLGGSVPMLSADIEGYLMSLADFATRDDCDVPIDLTGEPTARRSSFRPLVTLYGELLRHWPEFVRSAGYLHRDRSGIA